MKIIIEKSELKELIDDKIKVDLLRIVLERGASCQPIIEIIYDKEYKIVWGVRNHGVNLFTIALIHDHKWREYNIINIGDFSKTNVDIQEFLDWAAKFDPLD